MERRFGSAGGGRQGAGLFPVAMAAVARRMYPTRMGCFTERLGHTKTHIVLEEWQAYTLSVHGQSDLGALLPNPHDLTLLANEE